MTIQSIHHVTSSKNLESIFNKGIPINSYWVTDLDIVDYYLDEIENEGDEPIVISAYLKDVTEYVAKNGSILEPDYPDDPISKAMGIGCSEEERQAWLGAEWRSCVQLIDRLCCPIVLPASLFMRPYGNVLRNRSQ